MKSGAVVPPAKPPVLSRLRRFIAGRGRLILAILALALIAFGAAGFWRQYAATHNPHPLPPNGQTVIHSTSHPDETPISSGAAYVVPADQPRHITLPSIGASGFIQRVGLDQNNAVAVPSNVHLAGWYVAGAKPGEPGVSLIDGHLQGNYQFGIFKNLANLQAGDQFTIEFGDHSKRKFKVLTIKLYTPDDVATAMLARQAGVTSQLNLITCGGSFNPGLGGFDKRVLVTSERISGD